MPLGCKQGSLVKGEVDWWGSQEIKSAFVGQLALSYIHGGSARYPTYYWTLRITLARLNNKYMEMHVGQYEIPGTGMF